MQSQAHTEGTVETQGEDDHLYTKKHTKLPEATRRAWNRFSPTVLSSPGGPWILNF